jgi:hypothetical protein
MRKCTLCFLIAIVAIARPVAADEDFSVVVNPRTGQTVLRNDSNSAVNIDGYLFVADSNVFSTGSWSSLTDNATPGWLEGQATTKILSEVNLTSSLSVPANGTVPLGSPYNVVNPTAIGQPEPEFDFTFSIEGVGVFNGDVEFENDNNIVLVVDPATGAATLENQSTFNVNINSYVIQSATGVLDTEGWTSLETSLGVPGGWAASTGAATRIAEGNLFGSTFVAANGGSLALGSPVDPELLEDETDLIFQFSVAPAGGSGGASVRGGVLFETSAVPALPGDYNQNGTVDAADYVLWRKFLGAADESALGGNGDGINGVDQGDYNLWRRNFGLTAGAVGASSSPLVPTSVPEPTSLVAAIVLNTVLFCRRSHLRKCRRANSQ